MKHLNPLDSTFLHMDALRTPMHVGSLMTFHLPKNAPPDYVRKLVAKMREKPFMPKPFDCQLAHGGLSSVAPAWVPAKIDMDYHLRHSALPFPGGERELGMLIERLHSNPLDMTRPLWECHLIEGLEGNRFAMYFKAHHCAIDGMGAVRMLLQWLSKDPTDMRGIASIAAAPEPQISDDTATGSEKGSSKKGPHKKGDRAKANYKRSLVARITTPYKIARTQLQAASELSSKIKEMLQGDDSSIKLALSVPANCFNVRVSRQRRLATQILDLDRIHAIACATNTSVNDVMLAICGSTIRRYLLEHSELPDKSLLASIPLAFRREASEGGNAAAGFIAPLGTHLNDPIERLQQIHRVTCRAKQDLRSLSGTALMQFAFMGLTPLMFGQLTGTLAKLPPFFNLVISNVKLSKEPLYLMGAELEAIYPASFLMDGYALNITLVGYNNKIAVGILGCRQAAPKLQRMAIYTQDALTELENAVTAQCGAITPQAEGAPA
ncbi:Conserved hypothetical protein [gamma proteobacterium HdN1]|nr:Conserved hypothetical protein [gamma proteobacterium HdN1]